MRTDLTLSVAPSRPPEADGSPAELTLLPEDAAAAERIAALLDDPEAVIDFVWPEATPEEGVA